MISKAHIRLIFGLKVKQARQEKGMSLSELAHKTGISVSYLNEIEKGKKYPQSEKIALLAESLGVSYDWLVSLKLQKKLLPLSKLLASGFFEEFPLEIFGIEPAQFLEILVNAPDKVTAFISTLVEIARSYDMQIEEFYFSALRSYQEMHENYFPELEAEAHKCKNTFFPETTIPETLTLQNILEKEFAIQVQEYDFEKPLQHLRSLLKGKTLLINRLLNEEQKRFVLAREIGYALLKPAKRTYTFSWVEVKSFEEVLSNFQASYFAGALLLSENQLIADLQNFFTKENFDSNFLLNLLAKYRVSPETFLYRCTNLLPKHFSLQELFFLRFDNAENQFNLTKELHLSGLHNPHASALGEHYCRRWISISILQDLQKLPNPQKEILCKSQISEYYNSDNRYWVLAMARSLSPTPALSSVAVGIKISAQSEKIIHFLQDINIPTRKVGETCERCIAQNCPERVAKAIIWQKQEQKKNNREAIRKLLQ
ncbi:MAG: XRE family transcriptional regulator [Raineya sp.]|nr:XRE family transcriptional regulator [Raineya sp.]MDW8296745.1 XRE family transcriptional regulator [Raineya sp.]